MPGDATPSVQAHRMSSARLIILPGCIILAIALLTACHSTQANLEFSFGSCDSSIDDSNLGVREVEWIADRTVVVTAVVSLNCAETVQWGDYEVSGDIVVLKYKSRRCGLRCAECRCAHELIYRITDIDKKAYRFELVRS